MKQKQHLLEAELLTIQEAQKNSPKSHFRRRCQAIELWDREKSVAYIGDLLQVRQESVYKWINRWNTMGIVGLMILPGRGLKATLLETTDESIKLIKKK